MPGIEYGKRHTVIRNVTERLFFRDMAEVRQIHGKGFLDPFNKIAGDRLGRSLVALINDQSEEFGLQEGFKAGGI